MSNKNIHPPTKPEYVRAAEEQLRRILNSRESEVRTPVETADSRSESNMNLRNREPVRVMEEQLYRILNSRESEVRTPVEMSDSRSEPYFRIKREFLDSFITG